MNTLVSGLSETAKAIVRKALDTVYGENTIELIELDEENLRRRVRLSQRGNGSFETALVVLGTNSLAQCLGVLEDGKNVVEYTDERNLVISLNKHFSICLDIDEFIKKPIKQEIQKSSDLVKDLIFKIETKDSTISNLKAQINELSRYLEGVEGVDLDSNKKVITELESKISLLEDENTLLQNQKADSDNLCSSLKTVLSNKDLELSNNRALLDTIDADISILREQVLELRKDIESKDALILELNNSKLEMQRKLDLLETSTSRDTDIESLMKENSSLRNDFYKLQNSTLNLLSNIPPQEYLNICIGECFNNPHPRIKFIFAGSAESRKCIYKSLYSELSADTGSEYLILDMVTETYIDYVFKIDYVVSGLSWFVNRDNLSSSLTETSLENVKVISPGLNYVNDSFFLNVGWESRFKQLEDTGANIIVVCGDLSNVLSRVLFESFSKIPDANISIVTKGNVVNSRNLITNITGLPSIGNSTVCYYDYEESASKLYDITCGITKCKILDSL